jgi:hypothetical protein
MTAQSQRDCSIQPRVASSELPWGNSQYYSPTPKELKRAGHGLILASYHNARANSFGVEAALDAPTQRRPTASSNAGLNDAIPLGLTLVFATDTRAEPPWARSTNSIG